MTSIESIKGKCKAWQKNDGTTRYYVNDWAGIIGLEVRHYKTGNVMSVALKGDDYEISNNRYNTKIVETKVWFDSNGDLHIDNCRDGYIRELIAQRVPAFMEATA